MRSTRQPRAVKRVASIVRSPLLAEHARFAVSSRHNAVVLSSAAAVHRTMSVPDVWGDGANLVCAFGEVMPG